jgi:hypothetical protein
MPDYLFAFFFDDTNQVGVTGLTGTVDIRNVLTGASVETGLTPVEVGDGVYSVVRTLAEADYTGVMKTAANGWRASLSVKEIPRIDAAVSSRATPAGVWDYLTSAATAVGSIGKKLADLLAVFNDTTRTLTQSGAQVAAAVSGSSLSLTNRVSFAATLTGLTIPATWEAVYLTVKGTPWAEDADSILQILVSNPAGLTDGVTVYAGAPGAAVASLASLTVNQGAGTVAIVIQDNLDFAAYVGSNSTYDVKCLLADGTSQLLSASSPFAIGLTETRAV